SRRSDRRTWWQGQTSFPRNFGRPPAGARHAAVTDKTMEGSAAVERRRSMKRNAPRLILWLLNRFSFGPDEEAVTGDMLEQYQRGRGRLWFWFQGFGIVLFRLYRRGPQQVLHLKTRYSVKQTVAVLILLAAVPLMFVAASYAFRGESV